jgi:hypothetical protein
MLTEIGQVFATASRAQALAVVDKHIRHARQLTEDYEAYICQQEAEMRGRQIPAEEFEDVPY